MKTFNRKVIFLLALSAMFLVFVPQFKWLHAQAEEDRSIGNGSYQVELSFSSLDGIEQKQFFNKEAILKVENGQYTLSLTVNHPYSLQDIHIELPEKSFATISEWTENLVQFDVKDLNEPIQIKGLMTSQSEEGQFPFAQAFQILVNEPIEDIEQPTDIEESVPEEEQVENWLINFVLYVDGKKEPSIMNTYVHPVAKMIKKGDNYYAQMTILKPAWVTGLTVEQQGKQIEPTVVSASETERIIEFEVDDLERPIRMWVKVDIPDLAYHHQYFVELQFDEQQVATILDKPIETLPPKQDQDVVEKTPINTSEKVVKPLENKTEEPPSQFNLLSRQPTQPTFKVLAEEQLAFDRTLDANAKEDVEEPTVPEEEDEEEKQKQKQPTTELAANNTNVEQQLAQLDKVKIALLVLICVLSGWLLVRRLRNSKK